MATKRRRSDSDAPFFQCPRRLDSPFASVAISFHARRDFGARDSSLPSPQSLRIAKSATEIADLAGRPSRHVQKRAPQPSLKPLPHPRQHAKIARKRGARIDPSRGREYLGHSSRARAMAAPASRQRFRGPNRPRSSLRTLPRACPPSHGRRSLRAIAGARANRGSLPRFGTPRRGTPVNRTIDFQLPAAEPTVFTGSPSKARPLLPRRPFLASFRAPRRSSAVSFSRCATPKSAFDFEARAVHFDLIRRYA